MDRVKFHDKEVPTLEDMNALNSNADEWWNHRTKRLITDRDIVCMGMDVTENSPAGMSVKVKVDAAKNYGLALSEEGNFIEIASNQTVAVAAADPSNPRIDVVSIKENHADAVQDYRWFRTAGSGLESHQVHTREDHSFSTTITEGTPAPSPVAPSTPAGYLKLAEVTVGAGVTEILNANIKDVSQSDDWTTETNGTVHGVLWVPSDTACQSATGTHRSRTTEVISSSLDVESLTGLRISTAGIAQYIEKTGDCFASGSGLNVGALILCEGNTAENRGVYVHARNTSGSVAIAGSFFAEIKDSGGSAYGIEAIAYASGGNTAGSAYGVYASADGADYNYGVYASAVGAAGDVLACGVWGSICGDAPNSAAVSGISYATGTDTWAGNFQNEGAGVTNHGVLGQATGAGTTNYGVWGKASGAAANWAGYFADGNVKIENELWVGTYAAKASQVFAGYITIKDAAGNSRKVMICA